MKLIEADNHPAGGIIAKIQPFLPLRRKTTLANINSSPLALDSCHSSPSPSHTKRSEKHSACTTCTLSLLPFLPQTRTNSNGTRNGISRKKPRPRRPFISHGSKVEITGADFPIGGKIGVVSVEKKRCRYR